MKDLTQALANHFRVPASTSLPILLKTNKVGRNLGRRRVASALNDLGLRSGIEIGTCRGGSALEWCKAIPGLHLTCVDPYKPYYENTERDRLEQWHDEAQHKIRNSGYDIELWRMFSRDAAARFADESVDFVFIDGDHRFDAAMMDLLLYAPKVRKTGVILLHDYFRARECGVVDAVDAYTRHHAVAPWYVTYDPAPTVFWQRSAERV